VSLAETDAFGFTFVLLNVKTSINLGALKFEPAMV
jgi:hypothetical protein